RSSEEVWLHWACSTCPRLSEQRNCTWTSAAAPASCPQRTAAWPLPSHPVVHLKQKKQLLRNSLPVTDVHIRE
uniref:Uncharacterized protein n=1 Tax=Cynoglossus semilaevis TaxID=244447 RepID=A0A3P8VVG7_CYNSE